MSRFFITQENLENDTIKITGDDHFHLSKSLRMKISEKIVASDGNLEYNCIIEEICDKFTICKILTKYPAKGEASIEVCVYISATKGDKLELVTQKVTELGATSIIPFSSARSIVKFDEKSMLKRQERLQKIALEASKQSRRGKVPTVCSFLTLKTLVEHIKTADLAIVLYENEENISLKDVLCKNTFKKIAIITGPEGGFDPCEIDFLKLHGVTVASLGLRILRAETAPIACISAIMYHTDNLS